MNTIELLGDGLDGGRVMAWMLFPNDPEMRHVHLAREIVEQSLLGGKTQDSLVTVPAWMLRALLDGEGRKAAKAAAVDATKQGTVAGDLLALVYEMHVRDMPEPSFGKAIEQYKGFALGLKYGDGDALKYSEQTLRNYFDAFEAVSHLWAAFRLNMGPYAYTADPRDIFHKPDALTQFLGVAKAVGEFATAFVPRRTKPPRPVLDVGKMVCVPNSIPAVRLIFKQLPA